MVYIVAYFSIIGKHILWPEHKEHMKDAKIMPLDRDVSVSISKKANSNVKIITSENKSTIGTFQ
jgi:hypothetical protein